MRTHFKKHSDSKAMQVAALLLIAAAGAATVLLFTTKKGKEIREDIADTTDEWGKKFRDLGAKASSTAQDLQKMVSKQIHGISDEARERISSIIDEGSKTANKLKKEFESRLS